MYILSIIMFFIISVGWIWKQDKLFAFTLFQVLFQIYTSEIWTETNIIYYKYDSEGCWFKIHAPGTDRRSDVKTSLHFRSLFIDMKIGLYVIIRHVDRINIRCVSWNRDKTCWGEGEIQKKVRRQQQRNWSLVVWFVRFQKSLISFHQFCYRLKVRG